MSAPTTPSRPEGLAGRLKSFRNPTRAFTMAGRPASPSPTPERPTPTRSSTRDPSPAKSRIPLFGSRKSGSAAPSTDAVNETGKKDEPATDAPKQEPATPGHIRARSGSTVSSQGPMTPPPAAQTSEPIAVPKTEDPISDSPHDGASLASSRSPSRLRRKVSNLSRHSVSGSIRRLSLLGPSSPPQVEVTPVLATAPPQAGLSRSASISSLRRHASPEPGQQSKIEEPAPVEPAAAEPAPQVESTQVDPAPQAEAAPQTEVAPVEPAPQVESAPSVEPAQVEAPKVEAAPQPEPVPAAAPQPEAAPVKETTPAPSTSEAPKAAEPKTPVKPSASRNASTTSLGRSPTPDKPEPKRRGTLTNWARKSLDRRSSVSSPPPVARPPSRGPADSGAESDNESLKERERRWGSGLPVPKTPTPKKSEENIKRRFSLGRRSSESGHAKTPSESASETDKKPNWASKMLRVGSKSKKEKGDGSSTTPDSSTLDVSSEQAEAQPRPSLSIPDARSLPSEQRPLSAIVESPIAPNMQAWASPISGAMVTSPLAAAATTESPAVVKTEEPTPETAPVVVQAEPETSAAPVEEPESVPVEVVAAPSVTEATTTAEVVSVEATAVIAPAAEPEQPKDEVVAPAEEVAEPGTSTPPVDTEVAPEPVQDAMSPMSPNSPASPPCDLNAQREIARARSPRPGPSANRSLRTSPAPSIIGVKRKQPDEPEAVGKSRVRYLPDWAVSPAIQLAVTLSLVLPRRRRDVANPTNRKRGWWPLRRSGPRTELRYNAIRGVNEEVPIVSKTWAVPAAVRTTAKVVTAPARWMFHFFVPRSTRG